MSPRTQILRAALAASCWLGAGAALADTGVSDERVSLPDGPGSIGGIGENAQIEGNMGQMRFSVPLRVPAGFPGVTPELALSYSSGNGSSVAGIGWALAEPSIERMTSKGLPEYVKDDRFAANGGSELVRVSSSGDSAVYRERFEGGFVRYTWRGIGDGKAGYWTAESPDGRISYYGADRKGALVPSARVSHPDGGTFRYHLVETVDPFGHRLQYGYVLADGYPLIDSVNYLHGADDKPRFSTRMSYENRPDVLSDAKPGFDLRLTRRLSEVRVLSGSEQIRGYKLEYEAEAASGGLSRLARVTETGRGGVMHPIRPTFAYSKALGGACKTDCQKPFVVDMGRLSGGVDLRAGNATLIDINGDSLPDVLDTTGGTHTFYISAPSADGRPKFGDKTVVSKAQTSAFGLNNAGVQVLDVNGDGLSDMISARTGAVLCNDGGGDWNGSSCMGNALVDFDLEDDPDEAAASDPLHVRFFDFDNDKRIDLLRTSNDASTDVRRDDGQSFKPITIDPIGATFDEGTLQLADMNGDGLQDPVELLAGGQLRYRTNLGRGRWSAWQTASITGIGEANLLAAQLVDINGDGLADVVVVTGNTLQYALNRNGARFDAPVSVSSDAVDGTIPETTAQTSVLFADMNGNGSDDVVWVSSDGRVQFLDLFPIKPNLLARIDNGIGMLQSVSYSTALSELARDGNWAYRLTNAMNVVKRLDAWVSLTGSDNGSGLHEISEFTYRDGYYDGVEKQFRGFAKVERALLGDMQDSQQPGVTVLEYDVGAHDVYYNGLLLRSDSFALDGSSRKPLNSQRTSYADCPVDQVANSELPVKVRHICATDTWRIEQEGAAESEWASVQTKLEYDGYGNVTRRSALGVVNLGSPESPQACAACSDGDDVACGEGCSGDETYTETVYVAPGAATGGAWFLHDAERETIYGASAGPRQETLYFYDGPDFEGLDAGKLTQGKVSRVMRRVAAGADAFIAASRRAFDQHGNPIAELDPLATPDNPNGHRRNSSYDPGYGLNLVSTEVRLSDDTGPYALRREYTYESAFNQISENTEWVLVRGGEPQSSRDSTRYRYDEHGRVVKLIRPGDAEATPTREFGYELASPVSRVRMLGRSSSSGDADQSAFQCLDGRGRLVQTLVRTGDGKYLADGFRELNSRGALVRSFQPHEVASATCAQRPPENVPFTAYRYDPQFRELSITEPDANLYDGKASQRRFEYAPLTVRRFDEEDSASGGAHENTPVVRRFDGDGRLISIERTIKDGKSAVTRLRWDSLDNLTGYIDATGNKRTQEYDLLSRVVSITDPNAGQTSREYDAAGNLVREKDAANGVTRYSYDGFNRRSAKWDDSDREGTLISYRYDAVNECANCTGVAGQLAEIDYPVVLGAEMSAGFDRFGYDARRRPTYSARGLEGVLFETKREFDGLDRLVSTMYPDGQKVTRGYDAADRPVSISKVWKSASYDARGMLASVAFENGVTGTFEYDARLRSSRDQLKDAKDKAIYDLGTGYDRTGNLLKIADAAKRNGALARDVENEYDDWYRLTKRRSDGETLSFAYDPIDCVTKIDSSEKAASSAHVGSLVYGARQPNAVRDLGGVQLQYDATGLMTRRGELQLGWDELDRLVSARRGSEVVGRFGYGADEQRVIKDEGGHVVYYVSPEFEVRDGISVVYPRLGDDRLARLESDVIASRVLPDANQDEQIDIADAWLASQSKAKQKPPVERLLAASARGALFDEASATTLLHSDQSSNVIAATSSKGELLAERTFHPQGAERESTGFVDEYGYGGQEHDASTGFSHYRFRYLDPQAGRWISPDPSFAIVSLGQMNALGEATTAYAFVANNFGSSVDPTGLGPKKKLGAAASAPPVKKARSKKEKTRKEQPKAESPEERQERKQTAAEAKQAQREHEAESNAESKKNTDEHIQDLKEEYANEKNPFVHIGTAVFPYVGARTEGALDRTAYRNAGIKAVAAVAVAVALVGGSVGVYFAVGVDQPDAAEGSQTPLMQQAASGPGDR